MSLWSDATCCIQSFVMGVFFTLNDCKFVKCRRNPRDLIYIVKDRKSNKPLASFMK